MEVVCDGLSPVDTLYLKGRQYITKVYLLHALVCEFCFLNIKLQSVCLCEMADSPAVCYFKNNLLNKRFSLDCKYVLKCVAKLAHEWQW